MTSRTATRRPRHTPAARRPPRRNVGLLAGVALIAVLALGILVATIFNEDATDDGLAAFGPVEVSGDPLATFEGTASDTAVGQLAPEVIGIAPDGSPAAVRAEGEPTIVAFLAHWCPHCQAEVPRLVEAAEAGTLDGIRMVAVLTGTNRDAPNFPPAAWLEREDWPGDVLLDDDTATAADAFGLAGYPFLVALDGDGRVIARTSGELPPGALDQLASELTEGRSTGA